MHCRPCVGELWTCLLGGTGQQEAGDTTPRRFKCFSSPSFSVLLVGILDVCGLLIGRVLEWHSGSPFPSGWMLLRTCSTLIFWHWRCDIYSLLWFCTIYYCLLHSLLVVLHAIWHEFDLIKVCALVVTSLFPLFEVKSQRLCISFGSVSQVLGSGPNSVVRKYSLQVQVTHDSHKCKVIITDIADIYSYSQAQRAQIRLLTLQPF